MPNFNFRSQFPISDVMAAAQRKPQMEQQMRLLEEQSKQDRLKNLLDALSTGATMARTVNTLKTEQLARQQAESQMQGQQQVTGILSEPAQASPVTSPIQQFGAAPEGPLAEGAYEPTQTQTAQPTFAQTQQGATQDKRLLAALSQAAPDTYAQNALAAKFGTARGHGGLLKPQNYTDSTGKVRIGTWDPARGLIKDEENDELAGYARGIFTDQFGMPHSYNRADAGTAPIAAGSPPPAEEGENDALTQLRFRAPKVAEKVEEIRSRAFPANNPGLADLVGAAAAAKTVKGILSDPDPSSVGLASLGFHFAIMSGSNSQLSDRERESFEEPLAFLRKLENKGWKFFMGDLSPKMKKDLQSLAGTLERKSRQRAAVTVNGVRSQAKGSAGSYWNSNLDKLFPTLDELVNDQATAFEVETLNQPRAAEGDLTVDMNAIEAELRRRGRK